MRQIAFLWMVFVGCLVAAEPVVFHITNSCKSGHLKAGEQATITIEMLYNGKPAVGKFYRLREFANGFKQSETIVPGDQKTTKVMAPTQTGWYCYAAMAMDENKKVISRPGWPSYYNYGTGVLVNMEQIKPGLPCPDDFDEFWANARAELDKVPVKAVEVKVDKGNQCQMFDVKVDCAGKAPVSGYLCLPKNAQPNSLPAVVYFHGAGVRSSGLRVTYGTKALSFDVNAHGIENGKSKEFYAALSNGALKGYPKFNITDRHKIYFHDMYLRVMRALDYIKSRPEWDGKRLYVYGHSQGGGQSIAAAALDKDVTFCMPMVPANGDHAGSYAGRMPGWPVYYTEKTPNKAQIEKEVAYYDNVNFASRIHCEVWLSTGMIDTTCPPTSVFAVYNQLGPEVKKHIYLDMTKDHSTTNPDGYKYLESLLGL